MRIARLQRLHHEALRIPKEASLNSVLILIVALIKKHGHLRSRSFIKAVEND